MKKILCFCGMIFLIGFNSKSATILRFNSDKKFKIVQFTDIHWDTNKKSEQTIEVIKSVLASEKPDLVVFTGDIITSKKTKQGFDAVTKPVIAAKVPWAYVLGNHDEECGNMKKSEILNYLCGLPFCVNLETAKNVSGYCNFSLEIKSSDAQKDAFLMYFLDSDDYCKDKSISDYAWIKNDQIQWFRNRSDEYKKKNGKTLPAFAFFHIPLPEYKEIKDSAKTLGTRIEPVCSPDINSGLFTSFIEAKDIIGMFVGHDHDNDYIGVLRDIALAYGRATGFNAYGEMDKGARVIEIVENEFAFKTWIRTEKGVCQNFEYKSIRKR